MKRFFALAMALLLALTVTLPAAADIIFEPDDAFYVRHQNECDYVGRSYMVNGKEGYLTLYSSPGSIPRGHLINGERVYVSHKWTNHDGAQWAVTQDGDWMQMSELALIYDWQEFQADFVSEFHDYDRSDGEITKACLYSYPGGVYSYTMEISDGGMDFSDALRYIYTDANGLRWSYIGYYMGHRNSWICLDDLLNENLGIGEYLTVGQVRNGEGLIAPTQPSHSQSVDSAQNSAEDTIYPPAEKVPVLWALWMIPVVLVIVVVVVTAVIVRRRRK